MTLLKYKADDPAAKTIQPLVNVRETKTEVILEAEMVGLSKSDIGLEIIGDELVISGKYTKREEVHGYTCIHCERPHVAYSRSFLLSEAIDKNKVNACYENGILTVTLYKVEAAHPKKIEIKG